MPLAPHTRSAARPQRAVCLSMGLGSSFQDWEYMRGEADKRKERELRKEGE